jgi:putative membrane protein insertion efficiency factor
MRHGLTLLLQALVTAYRLLVAPSLGPCCRYEPSCSAYALEALERHGPWRGLGLALRRIVRCHPLRPGGYDPVPREVSGGP